MQVFLVHIAHNSHSDTRRALERFYDQVKNVRFKRSVILEVGYPADFKIFNSQLKYLKKIAEKHKMELVCKPNYGHIDNMQDFAKKSMLEASPEDWILFYNADNNISPDSWYWAMLDLAKCAPKDTGIIIPNSDKTDLRAHSKSPVFTFNPMAKDVYKIESDQFYMPMCMIRVGLCKMLDSKYLYGSASSDVFKALKDTGMTGLIMENIKDDRLNIDEPEYKSWKFMYKNKPDAPLLWKWQKNLSRD